MDSGHKGELLFFLFFLVAVGIWTFGYLYVEPMCDVMDASGIIVAKFVPNVLEVKYVVKNIDYLANVTVTPSMYSGRNVGDAYALRCSKANPSTIYSSDTVCLNLILTLVSGIVALIISGCVCLSYCAKDIKAEGSKRIVV